MAQIVLRFDGDILQSLINLLQMRVFGGNVQFAVCLDLARQAAHEKSIRLDMIDKIVDSEKELKTGRRRRDPLKLLLKVCFSLNGGGAHVPQL